MPDLPLWDCVGVSVCGGDYLQLVGIVDSLSVGLIVIPASVLWLHGDKTWISVKASPCS